MNMMKKLLAASTLVLAAGAAMAAADIPAQAYDSARRPRAASVRASGVLQQRRQRHLRAVLHHQGRQGELDGATADFAKAVGEILGLKVVHTPLQGLSAVLLGIRSGRYDVSIAPVGDFPDREEQNDFIDYVQEYVVFAVAKGNPKKVNDISDTCGLRVSVMAAGPRAHDQEAERGLRQGGPARRHDHELRRAGGAAPCCSFGRADAFFPPRRRSPTS